MKKTTIKFSKYSATAFGAFCVDFFIFNIFLIFSAPLIAQAMGRLFGGLLAFFSNRNWAFSDQNKNRLSIQGRRFILLYGFSYVQSFLLFYLIFNTLAIDVFIAKFIADGSCFLTNFLVMKFYVFSKIRHVFSRFFQFFGPNQKF
jgi:putative flippase GtrA